MAGGDEEIRVVATLRDELSRPLSKLSQAIRDVEDATGKSSKATEDLGAASKKAASDSSALDKAIGSSSSAIQKATSVSKKGADGFKNVGSSIQSITSQSGASRTVGTLVRAIQTGLPRMQGAIKSGMQSGLERAGSGLRNASTKMWSGIASTIPQPLRDKISEGVRNGITRAKGIVSGLVRHAREVGSSAGAMLGKGLEKAADASISAIKTGIRGLESVAGAVMGGIAAVGAAAFAKGFGRLSALEGAEQTFTSMGHSAEDAVGIMKTAEDAVTGTAFGLGESASLAAQMLASGVKPGQELGDILTTVANSAARGGDTMQGMGNIFSKVLASGRLQGDELNQMMERGLPILTYLSDHLGVATEDVRKLVSEGEVGFEDFAAAMQKGTAGAAEAAGKTFQGAMANIMTALGSTAAVFMEPFYNAVAPMAQSLVDVLKNFRDQAKPFMAEVTEMIQPYVEQIQGFIDRLANADLGAFFDKIAPMVPAIGALTGAFVALGSNGLARFIPFIGRINPLVGIIAGLVIASPELRSAFMDLAATVGGVLLQGFQALSPLLQFVAGTLIPLLAGGVTTVANFLAQNRTLTAVLVGAVAAVAGIALAYRGYQIASAMVSLALGRQVAAERLKMLSEKQSALATGIHTAAIKAKNIALTIINGKYGLVAAAQWAWNAAMSANPIGLIIAGIAALVAGLVWFFTKTETGKAIWEKVWGAIKSATQAVVSWFQDTVLPILTTVWDGIVTGVKAVGEWFASVWDSAKDGIQSAVTAMTPAINFIRKLFGWIGTAIKLVVTVYLTMLVLYWKTVWTVLSTTIKWAWGVIQPVVNGIWTGIKWLANGFMNSMTAIRDAITAAWTWIVNTTNMILMPIINWIRARILLLRLAFQVGFTLIRNIVSMVFTAISTTIRTVWTAVTTWIQARLNWVRSVWTMIWTAIRTVLTNAWNGIRNTTINLFTAITTWIQSRLAWLRALWNNIWNVLKNTVSTVWSNIKSSISNAWTWVKSNVFDKVSPVTDAMGRAFEKFRDTVTAVWDKVKESAKAPVKFVVNTIYRDNIKGTFDKIAGAVGLDLKLPDVKLKFASGGVMPGYTPGRDVHTVSSPYGPVGLSGGEAIMRPEWTRAVGSGFVDSMNSVARRGVGAVRNAMANLSAPRQGYKDGGVVNGVRTVANFAKGGTLIDAANWWVAKGARGSRHPAFGGAVRSGHSRNSLHYQDRAVDLNYGPGGQNATEMAFFDRWVKQFKGLFPGIRVIWRAPGHYNHMHIDTGNGADIGDFAGALKGGGGGGVLADLNPLKKLRDRMMEAGDHPLGKIVGNIGKKTVQAMIDKINPLNWFGGDNSNYDNTAGSGAGRERGKQWAKAQGWPVPGARWNALDYIVTRESSWNSKAKNPRSSASGLGQFIDANARHYLGSAPMRNHPFEEQLAATVRYTQDRYGGLVNAMNYWKKNNHYADGGILPSGIGLFDNGGVMMPGQFGYNGTNKPELVTSDARAQAEQRAMERVAQKAGAVASSGGGGGTTVNVEVSLTVGDTGEKTMRQTEREFEQMMQRVFDKQIRRR